MNLRVPLAVQKQLISRKFCKIKEFLIYFRYISYGLLMMGCGSLMFALPHFITENYIQTDKMDLSSSSDNSSELCVIGTSSATSQIDEKEKTNALSVAKALANYKYFFIFGQILHGIGAAPLITLGVSLLDESVGRVTAPLYIGIYQVRFEKKASEMPFENTYLRFFAFSDVFCDWTRHWIYFGWSLFDHLHRL